MTSRFNTFLILIGLAITYPCVALAGVEGLAATPSRDSYVPSSDELFKRFAPAILKIVVKLHGVPVLIGSGFFVSGDGVVMTNRHVMKNVIHEKGYTAEFILRDKRVVKEYQIGHCSDEKQIDLCLVKLALKPKAFFKISENKPGVNDSAYIIAHPRGMDFTIAYGLVKGYRKTALETEEMEISTPMGPGSSGGPLFDNQGFIIGVASKYSADHLNENFGIPLPEVSRFLGEAVSFMPVPEARERFNEYVSESMRTKRETELDPALASAKRGESLAGRKDFDVHVFDFGSQKISITLPKIFDSCRQEKRKGQNEILHACFGFGDSAVFTVQRTPAKNLSLLAMKGKKLLSPAPLALVNQLEHDGAWKAVEEKLSKDQKSAFISNPQSAKCTALPIVKNGAFSGLPSCQFAVLNDVEPGGVSYNLWIQQGTNLFSLSTWISDATAGEYFERFPELAALTARSLAGGVSADSRRLAGVLQDKKLASYSVELPEPFAYMGSKIEPGGSHFDLYAPQRANGEFTELPLYSVTESSDLILPPSYDSASKRLTATSAKISGATIKAESLVLGSLDVDGSPARIASGVGRDKKGHEAVVLGCVVYGKELTHVMTKILTAKDPSPSFREFKASCARFKRK